jgi:hypothetical protein
VDYGFVIFMAGMMAVAMFSVWLLEVRGVGASAFPGVVAYRLSPWARAGGMAVLAATTLLLNAVWVRVSALGVAVTGISLSLLALVAWVGMALIFLVFSAHVTRAHAAESRRRGVYLVELLIWAGFLWGQSLLGR